MLVYIIEKYSKAKTTHIKIHDKTDLAMTKYRARTTLPRDFPAAIKSLMKRDRRSRSLSHPPNTLTALGCRIAKQMRCAFNVAPVTVEAASAPQRFYRPSFLHTSCIDAIHLEETFCSLQLSDRGQKIDRSVQKYRFIGTLVEILVEIGQLMLNAGFMKNDFTRCNFFVYRESRRARELN
jgi:hypothetical protein